MQQILEEYFTEQISEFPMLCRSAPAECGKPMTTPPRAVLCESMEGVLAAPKSLSLSLVPWNVK